MCLIHLRVENLNNRFDYKPTTSVVDGVNNFVNGIKIIIRMINNNENLNLAIIGLGYVGLPLALEFSKKT